jgi:SAM-dependent methyltransferase
MSPSKSVSTQWYETFFQGIATELWSKCTPPELTKAEVDSLERMLACQPGARILDLPCGNGRHSRELAGRGYRVTGMDISRDYIDAARVAKDSGVEWVCADMRALDRDAEFDGAFCWGNSFGYLEYDDTRKFLAALARALKPGARFVLQAGAAEVVLPRFREREWVQVDDIMFLEANDYSPERSCVETTFTFLRDGKADVRRGCQFLYTTAEIRRLVEEAGLRPVKLSGGLNDEPFRIGAEMLYVISEKPA